MKKTEKRNWPRQLVSSNIKCTFTFSFLHNALLKSVILFISIRVMCLSYLLLPQIILPLVCVIFFSVSLLKVVSRDT